MDDPLIDTLTRAVPHPDVQAAREQLEARIEQRRRRRASVQLGLGVAMLVVLGGLASLIFRADAEEHVVSDSHSTTSDPGPADSPMDSEWSVHVEATGLDPLTISVGRLSSADATDGWLQHTVTFRHTGRGATTVHDFRNSQFLGDTEVLAAYEGCGYARFSPDGPITAGACRAYNAGFRIDASADHELLVTLSKDLEGMNPLSSHELEFRSTVEIEVHGTDGETLVTEGELVLRYRR